MLHHGYCVKRVMSCFVLHQTDLLELWQKYSPLVSSKQNIFCQNVSGLFRWAWMLSSHCPATMNMCLHIATALIVAVGFLGSLPNKFSYLSIHSGHLFPVVPHFICLLMALTVFCTPLLINEILCMLWKLFADHDFSTALLPSPKKCSHWLQYIILKGGRKKKS